MQKIKDFISKAIEEHLLEIEPNDYNQLQTIFEQKELEKLSFYLESNQDEKFDFFLQKLLDNLDDDIIVKLKLLPQEMPLEIVSKGMNNDGKTCTLFYGTNREPNDISDISKGYGNQRASKIHLGSCQVHVPKSHNIGEINGSLWEKLIHFDFSYGKVALKTLEPLEKDAFWRRISNLLSPLEEEEKQALIFIHGFNTSFEEASIRATQLSVDLAYSGVTAFFSWASQGKALAYLSDEATIQYSEKHLTEFLTDFSTNSGANRIHIIAHSMGNRALLEAVNRIQRETPQIQFGQIILAAPDVDADVFEELSETYTLLSEQTTLYVSGKDKAVGMSKWLHSHNRAGFSPPVCVVKAINTIEVESEAKLLDLGHGYFAGHKKLLEDIYKQLNFNLDANNREGLVVQRVNEINKYWKLSNK